MLKKFMIEKIDQEKTSDGTGTITFHIVDENGECRIIEGSTYFDEEQGIEGILSDSSRELPLLQTLFKHRDEKMIEIEFGNYNHIYDRDDNDSEYVMYSDELRVEDEPSGLFQRMTSLFKK